MLHTGRWNKKAIITKRNKDKGMGKRSIKLTG